MADATEIAEIAADGVADGMHIVSEEALAAERAVRGMNRTGLAYLGLGLVAGAAAGALVAFRIAYKQAETKYSEIAAEEIAEMRARLDAELDTLAPWDTPLLWVLLRTRIPQQAVSLGALAHCIRLAARAGDQRAMRELFVRLLERTERLNARWARRTVARSGAHGRAVRRGR